MMNVRHYTGLPLLALGALAFASAHASSTAGAGQAPRPNIVIVLADDLGFEALGCYGGKSYKGLGTVRTPNLDALAKSGMRFTSCFSTPVCSPARSELLTGKYNFRTGFIDIAGRSGATESLDPKAHPTLAAQLKAAGYVTAVAGKWHLGPPSSMREIPASSAKDTDYPHPRDCGFDRQCIFGGAHLELYGKPEPEDYTPASLQDWVLRFLDSRKGQAEPFFLYYPSPIPHDPILPTPLNPQGALGSKKGDFGQKRGDLSNYPYLIEYLDRQVGEVLQKLTELGLRENTLVLFTGDNGTGRPVTTEMSDGQSIPGGKGSMLDTGSQVPLLASWPGVIQAGAVYGGLVDFTDILPTCLEVAGAPSPGGIDGVSFAAQLRGQPGAPREWVHSLLVGKYFVRDSRWKLREDGSLYDVSKSPYAETLVAPESDTPESKAARERLGEVLRKLHPQKPDIAKVDGGAVAPAARPAKKAGMSATLAQLGEVGEPTRRVVYKTVGERKLALHIFEPAGHAASSKSPCFVAIHGGGWVGGEPSRFYPFAAHFAKLGCVGVSVEYRLVKKGSGATVFDCVKDGRSAVRYIRRHAGELGVDPDKIVVSGGSAGGHVAAGTALFDGIDEPGDDLAVSCVPNALVLYFPVIDTSAEGYGNAKCGDRWKELSPLHRVKAGLPPTLILHGTADTTTPFKGAKAFEEAMRVAGNRCDLIAHEGGKHGYLLAGPEVFGEAMRQTEDFLKSLALLEGSAARVK